MSNRDSDRSTVTFIDRPPRSGFIETDLACLETFADVTRVVYPGRTSLTYVFSCLRSLLRTRCLYVFFASEHALAPVAIARLLRRRIVLVHGGYDFADVPERGYGLIARGLGWLPRAIGRLCTVSLAISDQSRWEFLAAVPSAAPRTHLAHLGLDPDRWRDPGVDRDPDRVVTIGYFDTETWTRKGADRFLEASIQDPDRRYVLAGRCSPEVAAHVAKTAPANLEVRDHLTHDEMRELFWSAGVYSQLSWHETFGVAMAEAMLCGCVPVIGDSAALAEVAGRWAVTASRYPADIDAAAAASKAAREVDRTEMRGDVSRRFSVEQRTQALRAAVDGEWGSA